MARSDGTTIASFSAQAAAPSRPRLGQLYVCAMPLLAGLATFPEIQIGGRTLGGWLWLSAMMAGALILATEMAVNRPARIRFPWRPWALWLALVWISLFWVKSPGARNVQDALQLSTPLLVGVLGALFIQTEAQLKWLLRAFAAALVPLAVVILASWLGWLTTADGPPSNRTNALLAALISAVFLAGCPPQVLWPIGGWTAALLLIALTKSRMATMATILILPLNPLYHSLRVRAAAAALLLAGGLAIFYSPAFQQRFFLSGGGSMADLLQGEFDTSGRLEVWAQVWDQAWRRPLFGAGVGSVGALTRRIWDGMEHPHNDYLRLGFELGLVGLGLWLTVMGWQLLDLRRRLRGSRGAVRQALAASMLGLCVLLITAATDNTLIYNLLFTNPLFALIGAAYGADGQYDPVDAS